MVASDFAESYIEESLNDKILVTNKIVTTEDILENNSHFHQVLKISDIPCQAKTKFALRKIFSGIISLVIFMFLYCLLTVLL